MTIKNVKDFQNEASERWATSPADAIDFVQGEFGSDFTDILSNDEFAFFDETTHLLKKELIQEVQHIDDDVIEAVNINNIDALKERLEDIRQHPDTLIYDIGGGAEHAEPLDYDDFMDIVAELTEE